MTRDTASAAAAGPVTVVSAAPVASASAAAAAASPSGAMIASSSSAAGGGHDVADLGGPAVRQQHRDLAPGRRPGQLALGHQQRAGEIGRPVAAQRQHAVDDLLDGQHHVLRLDDHRLLGERHHAEVLRGAVGDRRRGDGARGQRLATHRATAVDEQAHGGPRLHPPADAQPVGIDGGARPARASTMASVLASTSRSPAAGSYGVDAMRPVPRRRTGPRRATSSTSRPASRRASWRSTGSVALVMSASSANAESGSSAIRSSTADSSSCPTAGDTSSKRGWRHSSRRDEVARRASSIAAAASAPSFRRGAPRSGPGLFPSGHRPRWGSGRRPEHVVPQLGDDLLRVAQRPLAQPDPSRQGDEHGVEADGGAHRRPIAQPGQRRHDRRGVERAAHRRADAQVGVGAGPPHQLDDPLDPGRIGGLDGPFDDGHLFDRRLVVDGQPADAVVDGAGDARRPDGVERVHRRHEPEAVGGDDPSEPWDVQLALAHHGDQDVEGLLRHPVELLDVQQGAVAHGRDERTVDEHVGVVAIGQHTGGIEVPDQAGRRQLGVALDELEADAELVGDGPQERRLAGPRRPLDEDVAAGVEGGEHELQLAPPADEP